MDTHESIVDYLRKKDWKELAAELIYILSEIDCDLQGILRNCENRKIRN